MHATTLPLTLRCDLVQYCEEKINRQSSLPRTRRKFSELGTRQNSDVVTSGIA